MAKLELDGKMTLTFSVKDRKVSAEWYAKHLGFVQMYDVPEIGWTEMTTPLEGVTAGFGDASEVTPGGCVPVFGVIDIEIARAALEAEDVRFDGETLVYDGMVKLATFFDPDGHAWMLAQNMGEQ